MITREEFTQKIDCYSTMYSSVVVFDKTIDEVLKVLNKLYPDYYIGNGRETNAFGKVVNFDIFKETPYCAKRLSKELKTVVIADTGWDDHYWVAFKDGYIYDNLIVRWANGIVPEGYTEDDDEEETYYDCDLEIVDKATGYVFCTGGGMCTQNEFNKFCKAVKNFSIYSMSELYSEPKKKEELAKLRKSDYKKLLYNAIIGWYDDSLEEYHGLDDKDFIKRVCDKIDMSEEEYRELMEV